MIKYVPYLLKMCVVLLYYCLTDILPNSCFMVFFLPNRCMILSLFSGCGVICRHVVTDRVWCFIGVLSYYLLNLLSLIMGKRMGWWSLFFLCLYD